MCVNKREVTVNVFLNSHYLLLYITQYKNIRSGLIPLHELTKVGNHVLRVEMEDFDGNEAYAEYQFGFCSFISDCNNINFFNFYLYIHELYFSGTSPSEQGQVM